MKRNMMKAEEQGREIIRKRPALDMTVGELYYLYKTFFNDRKEHSLADALFYLISRVYLTGLAVGMRNANRKS